MVGFFQYRQVWTAVARIWRPDSSIPERQHHSIASNSAEQYLSYSSVDTRVRNLTRLSKSPELDYRCLCIARLIPTNY